MRTAFNKSVRTLALCVLTAALSPAAGAGEPRSIVLAGGSDIVRIVPRDESPPPSGRSTPLDPVVDVPLPPGGPPPPQVLSPPLTPPNVTAGRLMKLPVRLGTLASDTRRAWIGVGMESFDRNFARSVGLQEPTGALLLETTPGGPAVAAGLRAGDVVLSINGVAVANADTLRERVAQEQPNSQVQIEIWRFLPDGRDFLAAMRTMANEGNTSVMALLGSMYATGRGVPRDDVQAASWHRRGANAGNPVSMVELSQFLISGRGGENDPQEGMRWLRKASDSGNVYGMWRYAYELRQGRLATKDVTEAFRLFQRSAESGFSPAMYDLALMHAEGMGVPRNYGEAVRWYQKAVDLNFAAAMVNLGLLYDEGKGVDKDDFKATELYRRAGLLGHVNGLHNWGVMLDNGRGVPRKDPAQAADLIFKALERGGEFSYRQMTQNHMAYTREFRMALQARLRDEGFYTGAIDGAFGQTTQAAITAYFNRNKR